MSSVTLRSGTPTRDARQSSTHPALSKRTKVLGLIALLLLLALITLIALISSRLWPFSREAVIQDLAEASDGSVTIRSFRQTYFPSPGCVLEGLVFRHGQRQFQLITIERLTIYGSYFGILHHYVPRILAEGGRVFIPPFGSELQFHSQHSQLVVGELIANGTTVEFLSQDKSPSLQFDVHQAILRNVRWGAPINYNLKLHNPNPPGEISVRGNFGPWATGHHEQTPLSGDYVFEHADLGVYGGIAGLLSSKGSFDGVLGHVSVRGETTTPDFNVTSSTHKTSLKTKFDAYVDATRGDTFLNHVDAHFGRTLLAVDGSVASKKDQLGKFAELRLKTRNGRIEDILDLFITSPRSPMSGATALQARATIPPGREPFLKRVRLEGSFGIDDGSFTKAETQKNVDELSAGARDLNKDDPETVLTDLKGEVTLQKGIATFSTISFSVPGAKARLHGTYNIVNHKIDLHGHMRVETKISNTSSGVKALLLKVMDPFFKKKKKGEVVPVHIGGTYEKPQFGLDMGNSDDHPKEKK